MNKFEEGLRTLEELFGNSRDNFIALATVDQDNLPSVRNVDAYYEDGVFYAVTYSNTKKMRDIELNPNIAVAIHNDSWFNGRALGFNLGWVLDEKNQELRRKLKEVFKPWYDIANDESDKNCCYLAIKLTSGEIVKDHAQHRNKMDFVQKTAV